MKSCVEAITLAALILLPGCGGGVAVSYSLSGDETITLGKGSTCEGESGEKWRSCRISLLYVRADRETESSQSVRLEGRCDDEGYFTGKRTWTDAATNDVDDQEEGYSSYVGGVRHGTTYRTLKGGRITSAYVDGLCDGESRWEEEGREKRVEVYEEGITLTEKRELGDEFDDDEIARIIESEKKRVRERRVRCGGFLESPPEGKNLLRREKTLRDGGSWDEATGLFQMLM